MSNDLLTIVTGASSNHFGCLCNLLTSLDRYEDARVLVHDLGLTEPEAQRLRDRRTLTRLPFDQYPPHFGRSATFAIPYVWKPVIIHDTLMAAGHPVLWLDAGNLVHERLDREREQLQTVGFYSPGSPGTIADWTHPVTLQGLDGGPEILGDRNRTGSTVGFGTNDLARELVVAWRDAALNKEISCPEGWSRKIHRRRPGAVVGAGGAGPPAPAVRARRPLFRHQRPERRGDARAGGTADGHDRARGAAGKRMAAGASQLAQPRPTQSKKETGKKWRGLGRLWHRLKKRLRRPAA